MNARLLPFAALLCAGVHLAHAHRVDEYLQATFIGVEQEQLRVDLFLTPGLSVLPDVLAEIDTDGDGVLSEVEQRTYADRVRRDLSFALNGTALSAELKQFEFPTLEALRDGRGDIHLALVVKLHATGTTTAKLSFENHHQSQIAAYQVNCLASRDPAIRIGEPHRDPLQATFAVELTITPRPSPSDTRGG